VAKVTPHTGQQGKRQNESIGEQVVKTATTTESQAQATTDKEGQTNYKN
jgi:hypothetical protein